MAATSERMGIRRERKLSQREKRGGAGDRTPGLDSAIVALSQLSYCPRLTGLFWQQLVAESKAPQSVRYGQELSLNP